LRQLVTSTLANTVRYGEAQECMTGRPPRTPDEEALERRKDARHEAGHAVAAIHYDCPIVISARLAPQVLEQVKALAFRSDTTRSEVVRRAVDEYTRRNPT
jgi:hypothetical protein